jgi:hypothetical protein
MVVTSLGRRGSMTNATGHSFFSPGSSVYCVKQKHSSLLKCEADCLRRVAGNGLGCHGPVLDVLELVHHRGQFTRMHLERTLRA